MPFMTNVFEKDPKQGECFVAKNTVMDKWRDDTHGGLYCVLSDKLSSRIRSLHHYSEPVQPMTVALQPNYTVEVKPPNKSSSSQLQSDLVKLGKEMKRMLDAGIEKIMVCGMLVEGFPCTTYSMDLKFDGIYRMVQLARFHLLRDSSDILLAPRIIENLLQVKTILIETVTSIDDITNNNVSDSDCCSSDGTPKSWKRPACGTPKQCK
ncbi:unnamed protein product [Absidia cylindrospora]